MAASLLSSSPGFAQTNGRELLTMCHASIELREIAQSETAARGMACNSYIADFYDGLVTSQAVNGVKDTVFCIPPGLGYDQVVGVYVRWAEAHPERLHARPSYALYEALSQAFPYRR